MNIREMHYDLRLKLNKVDSQKYRNLFVPELDWKLNEAEDMLVKAVAFPRQNKIIGFEVNQRIKDDLRGLVVEQINEEGTCLSAIKINDLIYKVPIPQEYRYYIKSSVLAEKGLCKRKLTGLAKNHGDQNELSPFDVSSFEWEDCNLLFVGNDIHVYTDETFIVSKLCLGYYKKSLYMHNAQDYPGGSYKRADKVTVLTGSQDCQLPATVHRDIVDIAVLITTGDMMADYNIKMNKVKSTD